MKRLILLSTLVLLALGAVLAVAAWAVFKLPVFGGEFEGERLHRMRQSGQFINGRFENTPPYVSDMSVLGEFKAYLGEQVREPTFAVPVVQMRAEDLGAAVMLPVHWATFNLAYHDWAEPVVRTVAAAALQGVRLVTPRVGEKFEFGVSFENRPWYLPPVK